MDKLIELCGNKSPALIESCLKEIQGKQDGILLLFTRQYLALSFNFVCPIHDDKHAFLEVKEIEI